MTTARETLAKHLRDMMKGTPGADAPGKINALLDEYRVQAKPGTEVQQGTTARESLGRQLVALWKRAPKDQDRAVEALIDKYRMQLKREGGAPERPAKPAVTPRSTDGRPSTPAVAPSAATAKKPAIRPESLRAPTSQPGAIQARKNAPLPPPAPRPAPQSTTIAPRSAPQSVTPLFASTPTGPSRRSECPKCKSRGVVVARSYTHEEFYSCIYCGWQAFKPFEEANADSPLAARLMAQRPPTPAAAANARRNEEEEGGRKRGGLFGDDEDAPRARSVITEDEEAASRPPTLRPDEGDDEMGGMHEIDPDADPDADAGDDFGEGADFEE